MDAPDNNDIGRGAEAAPVRKERGPGRLLQDARLERGLSIEDVARQLRLSVRQVVALEEDDYDKVATGTFLRGFVRNYAKLLQIDSAPLLRQLEDALPPPPAPTISYPSEGIPFPSNQKMGKRNLIIGGAVVLALLLLIYEIYRGSEANVEKQPSVQAETGIEGGQADALPQLQSSDAMSNGKTDATSPDREDGAPEQQGIPFPVPPPVQQITPESRSAVSPGSANPGSANIAGTPGRVIGENGVHLIFEGESWTEIKDGSGRLLLSKINPRGTEQVVHGTPPISLTIGNAAEVKLVYNNKPVDLAPFTNAYGGTARLSLK